VFLLIGGANQQKHSGLIYNSLMQIQGKTALVTGGSVRVGKAITLALARAGANVVVHYHSSATAAEETAAEARALGAKALPLQADLSDQVQVRRLAQAAEEHFGGVDILVNSASHFQTTPIPTDDFSAWKQVTSVLIDAPFDCANIFYPGMRRRGEGAIVNIVDLSAWEPWPHFAAHAVGKAALLALTRQLALEFAPAVRVNAVAPGPVLPPPNYSAEKIARTAARTLLERWGSPDDVANAVLFLVQADYITGDTITVDGGERHAGRKHDSW
jgi:3-oxoacyl-[acyl-carrier protein] reductase/pteridine reductase